MSASFFDCAEHPSGADVLEDCGPGQKTCTLGRRDDSEKSCIATNPCWCPGMCDLKIEQLGVAELHKHFSNVLLDEVRLACPKIVSSIKTKLKDCEKRLQKLGDARVTPLQQKVHLDKASRQFQQLLSQAVKGQYFDRDFFTPDSTSGDPRKLRASLQILNDQFAKKMFEKGHHRDILVGTDGLPTSLQQGYSYESIFDKSVIDDPKKITHAGYLSIVRDLMSKNRGIELPGAVDSRLVRELFCDQSQKWFQIAQEHLERALELVEDTVKETIYYATDGFTANKIYLHCIEPKMDKKKRKLMKRLRQLIAPYQECHPITYNYQYLETVANIRRRNEEALSRGQLQPNLDTSSFDLAASDLLDSMEAYYKVAVRTFVDNVAVLAVEMTLVSKLDEIFTPSDITFMEPEMVHLLASEPEVEQRERVELTERKANLEEALKFCRCHAAETPSVTIIESNDPFACPGTPELVPANQHGSSPSPGLPSAPRTPESLPKIPPKFDLGSTLGVATARKLALPFEIVCVDDGYLQASGHAAGEGEPDEEL